MKHVKLTPDVAFVRSVDGELWTGANPAASTGGAGWGVHCGLPRSEPNSEGLIDIG